MDIRFVICAQSVALDQRHNTLSIFHVIEEWNVPAFPFAIPYMTIVSLIERAPEEANEAELQVVITLGAQELIRKSLPASFQGRLRMRAIAEVAGIAIASPGVLKVSVQCGDLSATWPINISSIAKPTVQPVLPLQ